MTPATRSTGLPALTAAAVRLPLPTQGAADVYQLDAEPCALLTSATGKVLKRELRRQHWDSADNNGS
jgi:hypothetical protein